MKTTKLKLFQDCKAVGAIAGIGFLLLALNACTTDADSFDAATVCPAEGTNIYGMPNRGTFIDERDGQEYKYTTIGNQVWMAQNLNYKTDYSVKNDVYKDCSECGLWYCLSLDPLSRESFDSVCPTGWRVPTLDDWNELLASIGSKDKALDVLLSETWSDYFQGTNECGFNGMQTGYVIVRNPETPDYGKSEPFSLGGGASWWTQKRSRPRHVIYIFFDRDKIEFQEGLYYYYYSLRCVKN